MTTTEYLNKLPPYQIRMIAMHNGVAPSTEQIAKLSGLSRRMVQRMSYAVVWDSFTVSEVSRFMEACNCGDTGLRWRYVDHVKRLTSGLRQPKREGEALHDYLKRVIPLRHIKNRKVKHEILRTIARALRSGR